MGALILRRILVMIPMLLVISMISFAIIQLPPGDYLSSSLAAKEASGSAANLEEVARLRERYHLDEPLAVQYGWWLAGMVQGNLGQSMEHGTAVTALLAERMPWTILVTGLSLVLAWGLAIPLGIWCATHPRSVSDHGLSVLAYIGLSLPSFLIALISMFALQAWFGASPGGLFSPAYQHAPWSLARVGDLLAHLWLPVLLISIDGIAGTMRILRANLLDELKRPYVTTARAKGLGPVRLVLKYPLRLAMNPIISTIGWLLPHIVSGSIIISVVMSLPTVGPLLLDALIGKDMYLAGSIVMILATLTLVGTLLSDILLMLVDPRTRREVPR
jgi:peptide/nickel transport system permease protein